MDVEWDKAQTVFALVPEPVAQRFRCANDDNYVAL